jgi:hypothetical protein
VHQPVPREKAGDRDEQEMMDDLLAGLDARMFDGFEVSPVKVMPASPGKERHPSPVKRARSPLHVKLEKADAPAKRHAGLPHRKPQQGSANALRPIEASKPVTRVKTEIGLDLLSKLGGSSRVSSSSTESRQLEIAMPQLGDEELFEFDFDLAEIADLDEEILTSPPSKVAYRLAY